MTRNKLGRMNRIIGIVSKTGIRLVCSSSLTKASFRRSAAMTRNAWASGVPYLRVCDRVMTTERTLGRFTRSANLCRASSRFGKIFRSADVEIVGDVFVGDGCRCEC